MAGFYNAGDWKVRPGVYARICNIGVPVNTENVAPPLPPSDSGSDDPVVAVRLTLSQLHCSTIKFPEKYSHTSTWVKMPWILPEGESFLDYDYMWSDGNHLCYSFSTRQYVLNGNTWEEKTWNSPSEVNGSEIWTDGVNVYQARVSNQYVLQGDTWVEKTWEGKSSFHGRYVWTDGINIYYSFASTHYVLNGDTWVEKTWNFLPDLPANFYGSDVWSDGEFTYYSNFAGKYPTYYGVNYVLNGDTWVEKTWNGTSNIGRGEYVVSDGERIYAQGHYDDGDFNSVLV